MGGNRLNQRLRGAISQFLPPRYGSAGWNLSGRDALSWRQITEAPMGRGLILWLLGIPLPIIILLWLFGFFN
jgi:hypothetical protein